MIPAMACEDSSFVDDPWAPDDDRQYASQKGDGVWVNMKDNKIVFSVKPNAKDWLTDEQPLTETGGLSVGDMRKSLLYQALEEWIDKVCR